MRRLTEEDIKAFVYYGSGNTIQPSDLWTAVVYTGIFSLAGLVYGVVIGGAYMIIGLAMPSLTVVYLVLSSFLKKKLVRSLRAGLICTSMLSAFSMLNFFLLGLLLFLVSQPGLFGWIALMAVFLFSLALYCALILQALNGGLSGKKGKKMNRAAAASLVGFAVASVLAHALMPSMSQDVILAIIYSCCSFLAFLFSIGLVNILKYYYCVKYAVPDIIFGE